MFQQLFTQSGESVLSPGSAILTLGAALLCGLIISLTYMFTCRREGYSQGFVFTLVMIPAIIAIIILLVGSNVARAFSLAGAFSIVRFRSAPGNPKDISYIFFALAGGLACGVGFIGYGLLFAGVLCTVMIILNTFKFGGNTNGNKYLKIMIPENLNYSGLFDDIFSQYTQSADLIKVKTADLGSVYELYYNITLKNNENEKEFIDLLRCRNGNLDVTVTFRPSTEF